MRSLSYSDRLKFHQNQPYNNQCPFKNNMQYRLLVNIKNAICSTQPILFQRAMI